MEQINEDNFFNENDTPKTKNEKLAFPSDDLVYDIIKILDSKKAHGLKLLRVREKTVIADYFVICTGNSNTQIRALSSELEEKLGQQGIVHDRIEGYNEASWIIMDYGSVIVHIFNRELRGFYNLEKLWAEAVEVDIQKWLDDPETDI